MWFTAARLKINIGKEKSCLRGGCDRLYEYQAFKFDGKLEANLPVTKRIKACRWTRRTDLRKDLVFALDPGISTVYSLTSNRWNKQGTFRSRIRSISPRWWNPFDGAERWLAEFNFRNYQANEVTRAEFIGSNAKLSALGGYLARSIR